MKWTDIPKFTRSGSYEVDIPLDFIEDWISSQSKKSDGNPLNLNPDFQRAHVWTDAQRTAFVEYFLRGGRSGRVIYFNHPTWMNFRQRNEYNEFVIVDGKQRLEALRKFIRNEILAFGHLFKEFEGRVPMSEMTLRVNVNDLKTRAEVLQWYLDLNTGGTPHTSKEIEKVRGLLAKETAGHSV